MKIAVARACSGLLVAACLTLPTVPLAAAEANAAVPTSVDPQKIAALIEQLGAEDFFARERAQAELTAIGAEAFDALSDAAQHIRDVEVSERVAYLMRTIKIRWVEKTDPPEVRNLLQNYEGMTDGDRKSVIAELARLPGPAPLAALCRIVRYEPSQAMSKTAALAIISQENVPADGRQERAALLQANIGSGPRPGAEWVRAYLIEHDRPADGVARFAEHIDVEERLLTQFPHRTSSEIVMSLLRRQADAYKRLDRVDEMVAALIRMSGLEQPRSDTSPVGRLQCRYPVLDETLKTLAERTDWKALEQMIERFSDRIAEDPLLGYQVAHAYERQGDSAAVKRFVEQARDANGADQQRHLLAGIEIRERGWVVWAEDEYRLAAKLGDASQTVTLYAWFQLGESLHDRGLDLEAAQVLDEATRGLEQAAAKNQGEIGASRSLDANRARAHYFYALHFKAQKDSKQALQHLLEGLGDDQHDAEILIELFHVPDLDVTVRDRVRKLIREAADIERKNIEQNPDSDTPYNQLAWLISNTEGDFNEALEASKKSLELKPGSAGHMDTLGRCYYALGDYENAVKLQSEAVKLDPHSQQMRRQLKLFESALEKKRQAEQK